jgi:hypothetical protein
MRSHDKLLTRVCFCGVVVLGFVKMFVFSADIPWRAKYQLFSVPAWTYPGADARNIQTAARCFREGTPIFGSNPCIMAGKPVKDTYPEANVWVLNYPSVWVRGYAFFNDDSERFFMHFWNANTLLLAVGILIYCFRYSYLSLPLLLFSPITLLVIERGNIDATTFFFTFVPLLAFASSRRLQSFFIGFAAALKLFPVFGYIAFLRRRKPFIGREALIGALVAAPIVLYSVLELPKILEGTLNGFEVAYGLSSLTQAPTFDQDAHLAYLCMVGFIVLWIATLILFARNAFLTKAIDSDLGDLKDIDLTALLVSCSIFLLTFVALSNWAYRLIFLIPAFVILARSRSMLATTLRGHILTIFWVPVIPQGWIIENLLCFPLAIAASILFYRGVSLQLERSEGHGQVEATAGRVGR